MNTLLVLRAMRVDYTKTINTLGKPESQSPCGLQHVLKDAALLAL